MVNLMRKLTDILIKKEELYRNLNELYPHKLGQILLDHVHSGRLLKVFSTTKSKLYEVQINVGSTVTHIVDMDNKICTCKFIQEYGYPCKHICAVCEKIGFPLENYIAKERRVTNLKHTYSGEMYPVCILNLKPEILKPGIPITRSGRPKKTPYAHCQKR